MRKSLSMLAVVLLLAAAGCQKLNYSETAEVKPGQVWTKGFTAPAYDQEVKVMIEPADCSVSAYLATDANQEAARDFLERSALGKAPDAKMVLGGKTFKPSDSKQDYDFTVTVPARTGFWLLINGGKQTTKVKIRVVGK